MANPMHLYLNLVKNEYTMEKKIVPVQETEKELTVTTPPSVSSNTANAVEKVADKVTLPEEKEEIKELPLDLLKNSDLPAISTENDETITTPITKTDTANTQTTPETITTQEKEVVQPVENETTKATDVSATPTEKGEATEATEKINLEELEKERKVDQQLEKLWANGTQQMVQTPRPDHAQPTPTEQKDSTKSK
jgi:hypothetical protein